MNKDEIRAAVLQFYYRVNENAAGAYAMTPEVVAETGIDQRSVLEAQQYLVDKHLLLSNPNGQQLRSGDHPGVQVFVARLSASGIDFVEHPRDFAGSGFPSTLINIVAGGDVHYAGRDQQHISGNNSGALAQGASRARVELPNFPIEEMRRLLASEPEWLRGGRDD